MLWKIRWSNFPWEKKEWMDHQWTTTSFGLHCLEFRKESYYRYHLSPYFSRKVFALPNSKVSDLLFLDLGMIRVVLENEGEPLSNSILSNNQHQNKCNVALLHFIYLLYLKDFLSEPIKPSQLNWPAHGVEYGQRGSSGNTRARNGCFKLLNPLYSSIILLLNLLWMESLLLLQLRQLLLLALFLFASCL